MVTDCTFLENELYDVARLFKSRPETLSHSFTYENGVFKNAFEVDGAKYEYEDRAEFSGELEFKRKEKLFAKLRLYRILSEKYGEKMPWGALTGIRPTKLAYREKEAGRDFSKLFEFMGVSAENTALTGEILEAQRGIYEKDEKNADYFVSRRSAPASANTARLSPRPSIKRAGFCLRISIV